MLLWPGNNVGYFGPYESVLRGTTPKGHMAHCGAGRWGIGIEADGTIEGCPSLATSNWAGGKIESAPGEPFDRAGSSWCWKRYRRQAPGRRGAGAVVNAASQNGHASEPERT